MIVGHFLRTKQLLQVPGQWQLGANSSYRKLFAPFIQNSSHRKLSFSQFHVAQNSTQEVKSQDQTLHAAITRLFKKRLMGSPEDTLTYRGYEDILSHFREYPSTQGSNGMINGNVFTSRNDYDTLHSLSQYEEPYGLSYLSSRGAYEAWCLALQKCDSCFELKELIFSPFSFNSLLKAIEMYPNITKISVSDVKVTGRRQSQVLKLLLHPICRYGNQRHELSFTNCNLDSSFAEELCEKIASGNMCLLQKLTLRNNNIGVEGFQMILETLQSTNHNISHIDLSESFLNAKTPNFEPPSV